MNHIKNNMNTIFISITTFAVITLLVLAFNTNSSPAQNILPGVERMPDEPFGEYLAGRHALSSNDYRAAADYYSRALALDPDNVSLNQFTLSVLITDGRFDEAIKVSHKLKDLVEENDISRLMLFFEQIKNNDFEEALGDVDGLASSGILNLIKPFFRGWILAELDRNDEVEAIITGFDENTTFNFFNYFQSGLLYEYMGNDTKAEEYYSMALVEKGFMNLRAVEAYGNILRKQNKTAQAIDIYKEYLEQSPRNENLKAALAGAESGLQPEAIVKSVDDGFAEIFYSVSTVLMQDNVKRIATNFLQYALYFKEYFPLAHFLQAQIFESDDYHDGAARELAKIKSDSTLYFQAKLQSAWLLDDMDRSDDALAALKKLDNEYPNNREVLNSIAEFYRMHERYGEAVLAYDKILNTIETKTERDWLIYYTRGIVLDQEKRWPDAEKDFLKALELNPEQPMVMNYLAYSWVDKGMNYEKARPMLERAVELRPNDGYIIDSLGWALFKMGDNEGAVEILERAAQIQTSDWAINDHLGDVYWTVGRKNEARFQWRHALSLSPDADKVQGIQSKIKNGYVKPKE